ncbi:uncharacterized protein LOC128883316 [Hylaeus volcanicus]|uniref:uncharacterized protein LOC128883316 n=1 Tax=Hylaeus volcanicus TaxID=313075 RepID=UPI0023B883CE|nr:uncharacterized protein LOC128883316 [Hylaeus volcanicus]
MDIVIQHLIPTLVKAFIDAQKDGYYVRLRRRLSFTVHLGRLLELNAFIDSLKQFVTNAQTNETFIKFMAMLVESMTWLLEEGMSALAEVKKREKFQVSTDSQELLDTNQQLPSTTTASANDEQRANNANDEFDTQSIDQGHNVSEIPFQQLERLCKSLTDAGLRTIQVVATIAKIFGDIIVDSPILLLQVTTSLNCCLEHLIGPRCLELKVSCFEKYNFDPKALLATTIMIYISLASFDTDTKEKIIHSVCNDTRYFKKTVFKKAFYIASREELLSSKHLETFSEIILLLEKTSDILNAEEKWLEEIWDEIPDEYKDPIMDNLMEDPVKLPTSGHIMDRKTIERHLMTEEFDPYNRMALKFTDLIPQDELRLQIKEFVKKKRSHYSSQKLNTI